MSLPTLTRLQSFFARFFSVTGMQCFTYACLLMYPNVKSSDSRITWLPFDIDLLIYAIVAINFLFVVRIILRYGIERYELFSATILLFALFVPGALLSQGSDYASDKVTKLFSVTFLVALCPLFFFRNRYQINKFLHLISFFGFLWSILAIFTFKYSADGRLTAAQSNPITLARNCSVPLLWWTFLALSGKGKPLLLGLLSIPALVALFASGSRGPILFTLISIVTILLLGYGARFPKRLVLRFGLFFLILISSFTVLSFLVNPKAIDRMSNLSQGKLGTSEIHRLDSIQSSIDLIITHPLGIGWGGFEERTNMWHEGIKLLYPHNLIVEVFLEGGWIPGIAFVFTVLIALHRSVSTLVSVEHYSCLGFLICFLLNSMVSFDLNTNRIFVGFLAIGLAIRKTVRRTSFSTELSPSH